MRLVRKEAPILITIENKTSAMGSTLFTVFPREGHVQLQHIVSYFLDSGSDMKLSLIGQIAFVRSEKQIVGHLAKPTDTFISSQGFSDIIDLSAFILTAWVWKEQDFIAKEDLHDVVLFRGNINHDIVCTPNGVKLGFYHHIEPFPDSPPKYLFSAMSGNMLWNDSKTFVDWLIQQGIHLDIKRLLINDNGIAKM